MNFKAYVPSALPVEEEGCVLFTWNKKDNLKSIDLKNLFNTFEIKSISDACEFLDLDYQNFQVYKNKIDAIVNSYKKFEKEYGCKFSVLEVVPKWLFDAFSEEKEKILTDLSQFFVLNYDIDVLSFFSSEIFSLDRVLKKNLETLDGPKSLEFQFQKNFRFKNSGEYNVYNMPKKDRAKIIPQKEDHFLYALDFKQFEFRTFLDLHPNLEIPKSESLYDYYSDFFGLAKEECKVGIISYLYGKRNDTLDHFFKKNELIPSDNYFKHDDHVVLIDDRQPENKILHTIVQSISQYRLMEKILNILNLLKDKDSLFLFPLHDELLFSINRDEKDLIPKIKRIIVDEVYQAHEFIGLNYFEMRKI